jgi:hypothetical protein
MALPLPENVFKMLSYSNTSWIFGLVRFGRLELKIIMEACPDIDQEELEMGSKKWHFA